MKKSICVILVFCLLLSAAPLAFAGNNISVDASWVILTPEAPTSYETFAAEKLRSTLSEVFGTEVRTVTAADSKYIAVGAASQTDVSAVADNGYRIQAIDGNLHINGTAQRGLQIAAYRFLEEFCHRKVYTETITVLPRAASVSVPANTDIVYEPFFEYTETDWRSPRNLEYSMANGLTAGSYRSIPAEMGGSVDYIGGFCHTMGGLCETEKYADSHPEYLALHNGVRTTEQPCLTNPDVLEIATQNVLKILREKHDPAAPLQIVSVTQNDNSEYCECENCKAFEAAHGGVQSATVLNFVNQIADVVKENGYENVAIDTFAYLYSQTPPEGIVPRDNVIVRLCSIFCCMAHPYDAECNSTFYNDLKAWSAICDRLYIWDYTTHYLHPCTVMPNFGAIQRNMQIFYENNVKGVFVEGNYFIDSCDTEFGELRAYMISKCLQDPYCDLDPEIDGFLNAYYGKGGNYMRKIIDLFTDHAGTFDGHMTFLYSSWATMRPIVSATVARIDLYWALAKKKANEEQLANIERSELSWRWWKANAAKREFSHLNPRRADRQEELYHDLLDAGVTILQEFTYEDLTAIDRDLIRYAPPDLWHVGAENEEIAQGFIQANKLVEKFPPLFAIYGYVYYLQNT
ncbi:MAG: DUF4838 domain-containing protein [Clostridia bacterium]|nr:DUF4838 domain-containing protein [Clostridia bacterium]